MTINEVVTKFTKEHPDRFVNEIYVLSKTKLLIEAPLKRKDGTLGENSFVMNLLNNKFYPFNPMDDLRNYTMARVPKRKLYEKILRS